MDDITYEDTRFGLHAVSELLVAGPQYRRFGTIRMRIVLGGFAGTKWPVSVLGSELVWAEGRVPLTGSFAEVARQAGFDAVAPPPGLYTDGTGLDPAEAFALDADALASIHDWFAVGDTALRRFAEQPPTLWPEHFDLSVAVEQVNYGVSPGDWSNPGPYAYVGPWTPRAGEFWNASFGAIRPRSAVPTVESLLEFFREGRDRAAAG
ncbi:hypothetical protein [Nocardia aurantia]|uniref:Uncharacterized protein n=1 Tax=Nocardia aurantia TaxID=2585199 RepID=A0A7K0DUG5_9NOCA|nr:hypothetical protein [Nocardia aurantia]MQY29167.1 hypothetical protein [Nocardia aurantia]